MKTRIPWFVCLATMALFPNLAPAQLTIDASGQHKEPREASASRCGSSGIQKLPIRVALEVCGGRSEDDGKTVVEFVLRNSGKKNILIPTSPDPVEESENTQPNYSFRQLNLYVASKGKQRALLPGGAVLYGNEASATLVTLTPGESIRVRARVALPAVSDADQRGAAVLVAHATLVDKTVTIVDGKTFMDCVGGGVESAKSPEYTLDALLKSSK